ncbi:peptidyl-tRNA hydrolase 2, mitochondrial isoform X1 [Athalia rosae]|uniref:peptidyl-tRNA hydrolase 2, mitochondrial isoform X1 n=1 Tax=Athalia rosae TaxID=37344 RepID=UPI002033A077|nr:peptidyl-tRNA hydrolase 2, mitochondrial isoform X1 [Athalia rosae]
MIKNLLSVLIPKEPSARCCKMALVVRTDISMGKGKTAAQCAHAAVECYRYALKNQKYKKVLSSWEMSGQPKIVLKISTKEQLEELQRKAKLAGVITATIRDAGKTQLAPGTISVLGIGPASETDIGSLTSDLKLL